MQKETLWKEILTTLEKKISKAHLFTYFRETKIIKIEENVLFLGSGSPFTLETIKSRYNDLLIDTIKVFLPHIDEICYEVITLDKEEKEILQKTILQEKPREVELVKGISSKILNEKYRLSNFIVGECNELAFAASKNVVKSPGKTYNPLFIYGGVGMGKTHLLQAIGNEILIHKKEAKVVYTTTESFINDLMEALKKSKTSTFRKKYRDIDVLIIDDIQFLKNKEKTQEEFFHTFNVLHDHQKQIIISADTPPRDLQGITERLVSRFQSGMIIEIFTPDKETKMAILQRKSQEKGQIIDQSIFEYIAENIEGSIRDIEGFLNQVIGQIELLEKAPSLEMIDTLLESQNLGEQKEKKKSLSPHQAVEKISNFYEVDYQAILEKNRKQNISYARHVAIYILREKYSLSFEDIGLLLGKRNHATIIHAYKKVKMDIEKDQKLKKEVRQLLREF